MSGRSIARVLPGAALLLALPFAPLEARAHDLAYRLIAGPEGGISVNPDQYVLGGLIGFDGICLVACSRDLGFAIHALSGLAGNHATVRVSPRIAYTFWIGDEDTLGIELATGAGVIGFIPIGHFAEFCERTDLDGCGGVWAGFEAGAGARLWPVTIHAVVGTGELPLLTATASVRFDLWEAEAK